MNIFIDARYILRTDGTGRVTENLLREILTQDTKDTFSILVPHQFLPQIKRMNIQYNYSFFASSNGIKRAIFDICILPPLLLKKHIHIYYSFENFCAPFYFKGKTIITIHDLIPIKNKNYYRKLFNRLWFNLKVHNAVKHAQYVIVVSLYTKKEVEEEFPFLKEKIHVVYNALHERFRKVNGVKTTILQKNSLQSKKYLLCIGGLEKRKNNRLVIQAYTELKQVGELDNIDLVISGVGNNASSRVKQEIPHEIPHEIRRYIHFLPPVSEEELQALFTHASIFIFPSRYEGFGMPVLEAMAYQTPTILLHASSLPEVGGDACLYIEDNVESLKEKILLLYKDSKLETSLIEKAKTQLTKFSWKQGAADIITLFRS